MKRREVIKAAIITAPIVATDIVTGQKNPWVKPEVQKFGQKKGAAKVGNAPGDSAIRYGPNCGIRQAQGCRPQNGEACTPLQFGTDCRPSSGEQCKERQGTPCGEE